MAKQTFTSGQVLTAAQMTSLQQTAMLGGDASAKTSSYTLVAADAGTAISMSNAGATTITVNTGLFAAGDIVTIVNLGAGVCTITAGTATVATSGSLALAQNQGGVLRFTSASAAIFFQFATPASGDIEGVSAGVGISGGGTSGTVTITNSMATEIDAKGDLVAGTGADTFARLAVGADGTTLVADSSTSTGLKWATASSGSLTQLATQTFSNTASHTFSSISGSYKFLFLQLVGVRSTTNEQPIRLRFNSDTGTNYKQGSWADLGKDSPTLTGISVLRDPDQGSTACLGSVWLYNYASTGNKAIFSLEASKSLLVYGQIGGWNNTAAITSITIYPASGNLEAGTATLFGGN